MQIRNTKYAYGSIAKWLHWSTAVLFLGSYVTVYYRHWFTEDKTPENWTALQLHLSIGITIGLIVALRILWRASNVQPDLEPGPGLLHFAAKLGHYALYIIMIAMPITGYLGTGANTEYFFLFEIPKFELTRLFEIVVADGLGITFEEFEQPMDFIHKKIGGEWLVWILIAGHVLAALYHHYVRKDRTLLKMTVDKSINK